jgi:hypothetical protein
MSPRDPFERVLVRDLIRVNYGALNVEEFGSVYEGLLEYKPVFQARWAHCVHYDELDQGRRYRQGGLEQVLAQGGEINMAVRGIRWPGRANLVVSLVAIHRGEWAGRAVALPSCRRLTNTSHMLFTTGGYGCTRANIYWVLAFSVEPGL